MPTRGLGCREISPHGACWAIISERFDIFVYGRYPHEHRWRVNVAFIMLVLALVPVLWEEMPFRKRGLLYTACYPFIAGWLLAGGILGLDPVNTRNFSGFMLTLVIGVTGISLSPADWHRFGVGTAVVYARLAYHFGRLY